MRRQTNRAFGLTFFIILATIAMLRWWFTETLLMSVSVAAGLFLIVALFSPWYLLPLNWAWTRLAGALAVASNYVILGLSFFIVIWPVGAVMRFIANDPMARRFDSGLESYFVSVVRSVDESTFPDLF